MNTLAAAIMLLCIACPVSAQFLPPDQSVIKFTRYIAVRDRILPGVDSTGVPVGPFTLLPTVEAQANYNDNVFALGSPRDGDAFFRIAPSLRLQTNLDGRSLNLSASSTIDRFAKYTTENKEAVDVSAYGTQDLGSNTRVRLLGRFNEDRESRESQNAFVLTRRPILFHQTIAGMGLTQTFDRLQLVGEVGYARYDFNNGQFRSNGSVFDQQYRNADQYHGQIRAEFAQSSALGYFAQVSYDAVNYSQRTPEGFNRNSRQEQALAGVRFELPVLARGEVGVGYVNADYRDTLFRSFSGLAISSRVQLFPTELMTVTVSADRSVNDAGLVNSSGYITTSGGAQIDYELLRTLIIGAGFRIEGDRFNGIQRNDRRAEASASIDYKLRRGWWLRASYDYLDLNSTGADRYKTFSRNRMMLGLGWRL